MKKLSKVSEFSTATRLLLGAYILCTVVFVVNYSVSYAENMISIIDFKIYLVC
jgi:hypothetical protein